MRALLGTDYHHCEAIFLRSSAVPSGTALGFRILLVVRLDERETLQYHARAASQEAEKGPGVVRKREKEKER